MSGSSTSPKSRSRPSSRRACSSGPRAAAAGDSARLDLRCFGAASGLLEELAAVEPLGSDDLIEALKPYRVLGNDLVVFHVLDPAEIETGGFFPTDLIERWRDARPGDFAPGFIECWKAFRETECAGTAAAQR